MDEGPAPVVSKPYTRNGITPEEFHKIMHQKQLDNLLKQTVDKEIISFSDYTWSYGFVTEKNREILKEYGYVIEQVNRTAIVVRFQW